MSRVILDKLQFWRVEQALYNLQVTMRSEKEVRGHGGRVWCLSMHMVDAHSRFVWCTGGIRVRVRNYPIRQVSNRCRMLLGLGLGLGLGLEG